LRNLNPVLEKIETIQGYGKESPDRLSNESDIYLDVFAVNSII
jgi:hypothetical protein